MRLLRHVKRCAWRKGRVFGELLVLGVVIADSRRSDELSSIILNLTLSDDPLVAARGLDVFVTAACREYVF